MTTTYDPEHADPQEVFDRLPLKRQQEIRRRFKEYAVESADIDTLVNALDDGQFTKEAIEKNGGLCQARFSWLCTNRAVVGHHKKPRSRGGSNAPANCLVCCHACHMRIHAEPTIAKNLGFLV